MRELLHVAAEVVDVLMASQRHVGEAEDDSRNHADGARGRADRDGLAITAGGREIHDGEQQSDARAARPARRYGPPATCRG